MPSGAASSTASDLPPLLEADEPPPVERVNPGGVAPLLLLCDHASPRIPRRLGDLGLPAAELGRHIAWDIGAAAVARRLSARFDAPLVLSGYSRLVIDVNRALEDPTSIPVISDQTIVPRNRGLSPGEKAQRAAALFRPYHDAVATLVAAMSARAQPPAVVAIHSFTPVYKHETRPWHVGILWDQDGRLARPLLERLSALADLMVGDNEPYSGRDGVGYTVAAHAGSRGLPNVTFEIRQDLIAAEPGQVEWSVRIGDALAPVLADPALHSAAG